MHSIVVDRLARITVSLGFCSLNRYDLTVSIELSPQLDLSSTQSACSTVATRMVQLPRSRIEDLNAPGTSTVRSRLTAFPISAHGEDSMHLVRFVTTYLTKSAKDKPTQFWLLLACVVQVAIQIQS